MEDFVPYELAVKLKEKGFKEKCYAYYFPVDNELNYNRNQYRGGNINACLYSYNSLSKECVASDFIDAPTISQVLKWLRKTHNLFIIVFINDDTDKPLTYEIYKETDCLLHHHGRYFSLEDWDKANLDAIKYAIDNLI